MSAAVAVATWQPPAEEWAAVWAALAPKILTDLEREIADLEQAAEQRRRTLAELRGQR